MIMAGERASNSVAIDYRIDPDTTPDFDVPQHLYLEIPLQSLEEQGERRRIASVPFLQRLVDANFTDDTAHLRQEWDVAMADLRREGAQVKVVGPDHEKYYLEVPKQRPAAE
jgi:alpha-D-ribose 1-methylphosphonate 5-phosphate C-P lyase